MGKTFNELKRELDTDSANETYYEESLNKGLKMEDKFEVTERAVHPLLNEDSLHYSLFGDESIEQFEKMFTKDELMAWSKLNYYKYMFRLGRKDTVESEIKKMKTYEDYYMYLEEKQDFKEVLESAKRALELEDEQYTKNNISFCFRNTYW